MIADKETRKKRFTTCMQCPKASENKKLCNECGCVIKFKIVPKHSKCPLSKW